MRLFCISVEKMGSYSGQTFRSLCSGGQNDYLGDTVVNQAEHSFHSLYWACGNLTEFVDFHFSIFFSYTILFSYLSPFHFSLFYQNEKVALACSDDSLPVKNRFWAIRKGVGKIIGRWVMNKSSKDMPFGILFFSSPIICVVAENHYICTPCFLPFTF